MPRRGPDRDPKVSPSPCPWSPRSTNTSSIDRPVRRRTGSRAGFRGGPSSGFPARAIPPRRKWLRWGVAMLPWTPNSYRRWAWPLLMHSTSGGCRRYRGFRPFGSGARTRRAIAHSSANAGSRSGLPAVFRSRSRTTRPRSVRRLLTGRFIRRRCRAWATRFARRRACGPLRASLWCHFTSYRWHRFTRRTRERFHRWPSVGKVTAWSGTVVSTVTRRHARGFPVPLVRPASIVAGRTRSAPAVPMRCGRT